MREINEKNLPGNSFRSKINPDPNDDEEGHGVKKVVAGNIIRKKRPLLDRFSETFLGGDTRSVASYVVKDVLIPAAKNTVWDMVNALGDVALNSIEALIYGESKGRFTRRGDKGKTTYVSYNSFFKADNEKEHHVVDHDISRSRGMYRFENIVMESAEDAEEVLSNLREMVDNYDVATVADFYQMVGADTDFADNTYGWTSLATAKVHRVRQGFILIMPKPRLIE